MQSAEDGIGAGIEDPLRVPAQEADVADRVRDAKDGRVALEDGRTVRLVPGTCLNIPPGFIHNEVSYSPDMEVMVFTSPAVIGSVPIDPPATA